MKRKEFEENILNYLEDKLRAEDKLSFKRALNESMELKALFEEYKSVIELEEELSRESEIPGSDFSVKVLNSIDTDAGFFRRITMTVARNRFLLTGATSAICLVIAIGVLMQNNLQKRILPAPVVSNKVKSTNKTAAEEPAAQNSQDLSLAKESLDQDSRTLSDKVVEKEEVESQDLLASKKEKVNQVVAAPAVAPLGKRASREAVKGLYEDSYASSGHDGIVSRDRVLVDQDSFAAGANELKINPSAPGFDRKAYYSNNTGETYKEWEENQRIEVGKEALSTFSIDVDTGSYTNARRFLVSGKLPPADSVRIEEFLNYFDYDYPNPENKAFGLSYEIAPSPLEQDRYLLKLGVKAKEQKSQNNPWNLVFLIDVSGSMTSEDKLGMIKKSLTVLINNMKSSDTVAIVTYAGHSGVLLEPTGISKKDQIIAAIEALNAGGSTNGSAGIVTAYDLAKKHMTKNSVNRVVLLTDGDFNVGTSSHDQLIDLIEEKRKTGVTLTTIGLGTGNYNEALMEQLANKGNGNYFYLDTFKEARKVFAKELVQNIEVVAKDVKIQVEFNPAVVSHYRLIGYDNRRLKKEDFNDDTVDAGEVGNGHTVTALYEVVLRDSDLAKQLENSYRYQKSKNLKLADASDKEIAFLKLRYKEPEGTKSQLLTFPILKSDMKAMAKEASSDFKFVAAVSYLGHKLRNSKFVGNYSFKDIAGMIKANLGKDEEGNRRELLTLVENIQ